MLISTEKGNFSTDSFEEIADMIRNSKEVWISGDEKYPCLALLVNEDKVCVNYFGSQEDDLWLSRGITLQRVSLVVSGEEWIAPEDAVISLEQAFECVKEFISTLCRPECIDWQYGV